MWSTIVRISSLLIGTTLLVFTGLTVSVDDAYAQKDALTTADYSDDVIQRVARVYVGIRNIREKYEQKLQAIENPARAAPLQRERRDRIKQLLFDHNLTREEYERITTAAQSNRELYTRLNTAIRKIEQE